MNDKLIEQLYVHSNLKPINKLHLVGTHDSAAFQFSGDYMPNSLVKGLSMRFLEFIRNFACVNEILTDWTLTQNMNIYNQLKLGIRVFDLRLAVTVTDKLVLAHSFACLRVTDFFEQVKKFLDENTEEIVVIFVKPDWMHRDNVDLKAWSRFYKIANDTVGNLLFPMRFNNVPTLQECKDSKKRVFIDVPSMPDIPLEFWSNLRNQFNEASLNDSPSNDVVKQDILDRLFKCGYKKKTLHNFSKTPEQFYEQYTQNIERVWWMDFPTIEFVNKLNSLNN